jgi:hypothetical protein
MRPRLTVDRAHFPIFITALPGPTRYPPPPARQEARTKEVPTELTDFSDDEGFVLFISGIAAAVFMLKWYAPLLTLSPLGRRRAPRITLAAAPIACLALLLPVLQHYGSHELRDDGGYVLLFMLAGAAWLGLADITATLLGVSQRYDALDHRNRPAAIALAGAQLGITLAYAGANIGEGATIWMTFGPAAVVTLAWAAVWTTHQSLTNVADAVTIERDPASAWRLAGLLTAAGLILGRSVAGDYQSPDQTLADFARQGWPVLLLLCAATWLQRRHRPTAGRPRQPWFTRGMLLALAYLLAAAAYVACLGPWNHAQKGGH